MPKIVNKEVKQLKIQREKYIKKEINRSKNILTTIDRLSKELFLSKQTILNDAKK